MALERRVLRALRVGHDVLGAALAHGSPRIKYILLEVEFFSPTHRASLHHLLLVRRPAGPGRTASSGTCRADGVGGAGPLLR